MIQPTAGGASAYLFTTAIFNRSFPVSGTQVPFTTVGAIQRQLLVLENQGGTRLFGEPALDLADMMRVLPDGRGQVNILAADKLMTAPRLYSTFLLWLLNELKRRGYIPQDVIFKVSIFAGHASAAGGHVLQMLGAGTFNPLGDLSLPPLASIRQGVDIPLDLHIYLSDSFGGFNRFYEAAEMARVCSPCYFKIEPGPALVSGGGAMYKPWSSPESLASFAREKVKYAQIIHEMIQASNPRLCLSPTGSPDLAIPKP